MNTRVFFKNKWIGEDLVFEMINGIPHASFNTKLGYALAMQVIESKHSIKLPDGKFYRVLGKDHKYTTSPKRMWLIETRDNARKMRLKTIETIWKVAVLEDKTMVFLKKNP